MNRNQYVAILDEVMLFLSYLLSGVCLSLRHCSHKSICWSMYIAHCDNWI